MSPRRPHIVGLEWDEYNERHVEEHIDPWLIQDLIEGEDWFAFRNYRGHPPEHRLFIGRTPAGVFVTAVLREPGWENPGIWRTITGWLLTDVARKRFQDEEERRGATMARRAINPVSDPFTPIASEKEWDEKGWARESEPLMASPPLGAMISIKLDPDSALLVRGAARLMGVTWSEFVRRAAIEAAAEAVRQSEQ